MKDRNSYAKKKPTSRPKTLTLRVLYKTETNTNEQNIIYTARRFIKTPEYGVRPNSVYKGHKVFELLVFLCSDEEHELQALENLADEHIQLRENHSDVTSNYNKLKLPIK